MIWRFPKATGFLNPVNLLPLMLVTLMFSVEGHADSVEVNDAWARATPPGARTAAVYLSLTAGETADRLIGGHTELAREVQVHTHIHEQGMMRMEQIEALVLTPHKTVQLRPGADHLMLIGLQQGLVAGDHFTLTLTFEDNDPMELSIPIRDMR